MALAWYRKWRPQTFSQVVGQEHVVRTLSQALTSGQVSHAYLFCGPRGVGKTTMARLLAKALNCQARPAGQSDPCNQCEICQEFDRDSFLDCLEIDAASNRGIDDIRQIKETVSLAPLKGAYKVYIIDEVHMLTKEAFNALLKTLEEPPSHVLMILATTEILKVPPTIISRCQRFDFYPLPSAALAKHLRAVAETEGLELDHEGAELLAEAAEGSGRDGLSLLQQVSVAGPVLSRAVISKVLGFVSVGEIESVLEQARGVEVAVSLATWDGLLKRGSDPEQCVRAVLRALAQVIKKEREPNWSAGLVVEQLVGAAAEWGWAISNLKGHPEPYLVIATAQAATHRGWLKAPLSRVASSNATEVAAKKTVVVEQTPPPNEPAIRTVTTETWRPGEDEQRFWQRFIATAEPHNHSLAALLKDATLLELKLDEDPHLIIGVHFPFHRGRLMELKNRLVLEEVLKELTGQPVHLTCTLIASEKPRQADDEGLLESAQHIFKG